MVDASAITLWPYIDAPEDLQALTDHGYAAAWVALIPRTYVDQHDLFWLEHMDRTHTPEKHPHPSLSEYQVWIGHHA